MKIPSIAGVLAKAFAAKAATAATEVALEAIQAKAVELTGAKAVDAKRLKRHVLKIQRDLKLVETASDSGSAEGVAIALAGLHNTLFVGLAVLEDEIGEQLLPGAPAGTVSTQSGGSGKTRPDVSAE